MSTLKNVEATVGAPTETPSQEASKKATEAFIVTDAKGRALMLKKPTLLSQYHLVELAGPERAKNQVLINMINPLLWVKKIDDVDVFFPKTWREVEALIQMVDDEGIEVISAELEKRYGKDADKQVEDREHLKG